MPATMHEDHPRSAEVPRKASALNRVCAVIIELMAIQLLFVGLVQLFPDLPREWGNSSHPFLLLAWASVRILCEAAWGTSPGKYLAKLRVVFFTRTGDDVSGWHRLPRAVLRNGWLWLPPLATLIGPDTLESDGWAWVVALSILIRGDDRSLADLLAGAEVVSSRTGPGPEFRGAVRPTSLPPQRALAWAVDMTVAMLLGGVLGRFTDWPVWVDAVAVLGLLRVVTEWVGLPTPGKAVLGLRVSYRAWFDRPVLVFLQVPVRNLWVPAALFYYATNPFSTPLTIEALVMFFILVAPDHRGVTDQLAGAYVTDIRGTASAQ
ncbi:RDD family protein [Corynebacterium halotolerans]|uniref:RDD domain-containing protein n=1 Tax=Corynebacterium halotolerans YIM 70093 = DSM 44683 TaxID=1121362 RepID=M1NWK1_9CORY|nr:RDD family protein [Corynebacterium halotolerans]AGF71870.1 hypothetical protein A605_04295 [Corynebacterium halotolerans YIM 70093 = DSM 44683]